MLVEDSMRVLRHGSVALLLFLGFMPTEAKPGQHAVETLYLLKDRKHEQWCAFRDQRQWRASVDSLSASVVATADFVDGRISAVEVTEQDETGDWIVYDHYSLAENGRISKLKRTVNSLPSDRSDSEIFQIANGVAQKESTASRKLSNGEPVTRSTALYPDPPIVTSIQSFPFFPLLAATRLEDNSSKSCVHVRDP
jgi:hypothetical protein